MNDQFIEIAYVADDESKPAIRVDARTDGQVFVVTDRRGMAYLAELAVDFLLVTHPADLVYELHAERELEAGSPTLRLEFEESLDSLTSGVTDAWNSRSL
jgi:hypothetical protein